MGDRYFIRKRVTYRVIQQEVRFREIAGVGHRVQPDSARSQVSTLESFAIPFVPHTELPIGCGLVESLCAPSFVEREPIPTVVAVAKCHSSRQWAKRIVLTRPGPNVQIRKINAIQFTCTCRRGGTRESRSNDPRDVSGGYLDAEYIRSARWLATCGSIVRFDASLRCEWGSVYEMLRNVSP